MPKSILDQLADGPVLGDGGYVFILKERGVPMADFSPYGILTHEQTVRQLYTQFFDAGVDVVQAQTFQGTRNRLEGVGMGAHYEDIHRKAVTVAREVVGDEVLLAGSIGSAVGSRGLAAQGLTVADARELYREECELMASLGVDFLILETLYYLEDALAALEAAKTTGLSVMATMSCKPELKSRDGFEMEACTKRLKDAGADIVGLNCMQDATLMLPLMERIREAVDGPIASQPVAVQCAPHLYMGLQKGTGHNVPSRRRRWRSTLGKHGRLGLITSVPATALAPNRCGQWQRLWANRPVDRIRIGTEIHKIAVKKILKIRPHA